MLLKKVARVILYFLGGLLVLLLLLQFLVSFYFNKKIGDRIHKEFEKGVNAKYRLDFDTPTLSLFERSIEFTNVKLVPVRVGADTTKVMYSLFVNNLKVSGLAFFDFYSRKDLNADNLKISGLTVMVYQATPVKKEKVANNKETPVKENSSDRIHSVLLRSIQINDAQLKVFHNHNDSSETFSTEENTVNIKNFKIDSITRASGQLFNADVFDISMNRLSYRFPDGLYTLKGKKLSTSYYDSVIRIDSVALIPNFSKERFGEIVGHQISRTKFNFSQMIFTDLNARYFIENNVFISDKLTLEGMSINVFRDKNIPFKEIVRPSLQQIVRSMPFMISIDSVSVRNGTIVYEELPEGLDESLKFSFDNVNALILGLSNDTFAYTDKSELKFISSALFMKKSELNLTCLFPLNTKKEIFNCSGNLTSMPFNTLNEVLKSKSHIIADGQLDSLRFAFYADEIRSNGFLRFIYHDLKITFLDKEGQVPKMRDKVRSFLLEKIFIIESNPGKDGKVRETRISFKRDPYRFFLYYIWKSVQSGIAPAIGLPGTQRKK